MRRRKAGAASGLRGALALLTSVLALLLAVSGYAGGISGYADYVAALLPLSLFLGMTALLLARGRWLLRLMAILALALALERIIPEWLARPQPSGNVGTTITIVSHNVHHGGIDPAGQAQKLAQSGADVLLLQENDRRSAAALQALTEAYRYRDACGTCELAILSKWPIVGRVHWRLPGVSGRGRYGPALFRADVRLPDGRTIRVATVHAPRPLPVEHQAAFFTTLVDAMRVQRPRALILAGDFNQTPWSHRMQEVDGDLIPMKRITRSNFTYPALWPLLPIDHVFVSPDFIVEQVDVLSDSGSDHRPVRVRLRLP
jgi:endonuclease/exonuclease/phosphatase (EEP) superfamily protein YafD